MECPRRDGRYNLDTAYLENDAQPAPPAHSPEVLEPSLMLALIGCVTTV